MGTGRNNRNGSYSMCGVDYNQYSFSGILDDIEAAFDVIDKEQQQQKTIQEDLLQEPSPGTFPLMHILLP